MEGVPLIGGAAVPTFPAPNVNTSRKFRKHTQMPNIKSARKRMGLSRAARSRNREARSRIRTAMRRVRQAGSMEEAEERRRVAVALIDRAAARRVIHPNKAGRIKSQLDQLVRANR